MCVVVWCVIQCVVRCVVELPYPPSVTSVKLSTDSRREVNVAWQPGYDGKSPISRFIVQYRLLPPGQCRFYLSIVSV